MEIYEIPTVESLDLGAAVWASTESDTQLGLWDMLI